MTGREGVTGWALSSSRAVSTALLVLCGELLEATHLIVPVQARHSASRIARLKRPGVAGGACRSAHRCGRCRDCRRSTGQTRGRRPEIAAQWRGPGRTAPQRVSKACSRARARSAPAHLFEAPLGLAQAFLVLNEQIAALAQQAGVVQLLRRKRL